MADFPITEGYFLLSGRNKENARKAISEAQERGYGADSVLTRHDGYLIPLGKGDAVAVEGDEPESDAPDKTWKNDDIVEWAKGRGIDLTDATTKADMLAAIEAASEKEEEGE